MTTTVPNQDYIEYLAQSIQEAPEIASKQLCQFI